MLVGNIKRYFVQAITRVLLDRIEAIPADTIVDVSDVDFIFYLDKESNDFIINAGVVVVDNHPDNISIGF